MKLLTLNFWTIGNTAIRGKNYFIVFISLMLLSGCQILSQSNQEKMDYSHYYLWIKNLTEEEISQEISRQKSNQKSDLARANIPLIMLYSLPHSPVHNPYTAKTQLNHYQLEPYEETSFNTTDLAFVVMLKDQLNQQLLLLEQLNHYKGAYKQAKQLISTQQVEIFEADKIISQLNKKIIQLKNIEKAISKHGK